MKKPVVLIVDDDPEIADLIVESVATMGFQCVVASCYEDVLPLIKDQNLVLAVVDIFVPGIGGIEGISRIKSVNDACRVIAVSGGFRRMNGADALRAAEIVGADAILPKPFRPKELCAIVSEVLDTDNGQVSA
ncbi:MAG: response regulator [Rhodospirillales bacterium]|nr:response regulator [Rhodospirillales bacterium]